MSTPDFKAWIGITRVKEEPGIHEAKLSLQDHHRNSLGWIHGGVYMTLLDTVMGNAVLSLKESRGWKWGATSDLSIQFQRPATTDSITGVGEVSKVGNHLVFVEGTIRDTDGTILCRAQGTWFVSPEDSPQ